MKTIIGLKNASLGILLIMGFGFLEKMNGILLWSSKDIIIFLLILLYISTKNVYEYTKIKK